MPKVREAIKLIEADGWRKVTTKGSHRQFKHTLLHGRDRPHTGQSFREPLGHRERGVIGRGQMSRSVGTSQSQYLAKTEVYVASL